MSFWGAEHRRISIQEYILYEIFHFRSRWYCPWSVWRVRVSLPALPISDNFVSFLCASAVLEQACSCSIRLGMIPLYRTEDSGLMNLNYMNTIGVSINGSSYFVITKIYIAGSVPIPRWDGSGDKQCSNAWILRLRPHTSYRHWATNRLRR